MKGTHKTPLWFTTPGKSLCAHLPSARVQISGNITEGSESFFDQRNRARLANKVVEAADFVTNSLQFYIYKLLNIISILVTFNQIVVGIIFFAFLLQFLDIIC